MNIVILTGNELRHEFMRKFISNDPSINTVMSICEGAEKSLKVLVENDDNPDDLRLQHLRAREASEHDFFRLYCESVSDTSNPRLIKKGAINDPNIVEEICNLKPDLIVAYGCSLIKSKLLTQFSGRFLNVHLGLSPYYRGSGTNFWPLVNAEPEFVGATFMYIDEGVDTGEVIHQLRAKVFDHDMPVQIGNRLIVDIAKEYVKVIKNFDNLEKMSQTVFNQDYTPKYYRKKDYTENSVQKLYELFNSTLVSDYLSELDKRHLRYPIIKNTALNK